MQGTFSAARGLLVADPMPQMVAIDTADFSTCSLSNAGVAFCWGINAFGELGAGDDLPQIIPAASNSHIAFRKVSLSTGGGHACGLDVNGQAYCWGNRTGGRMGDGMQGPQGSHTDHAMPVSGGMTFIDIAAGGNHVCAVASGGSAWCWGYNDAGQLGTGDFLARLEPTKVSGGKLFKSITAHQMITCGVATDDTAWCWGDGSSGGLGIGTTGKTNVPLAVSGQLKFSRLQLSLWSTCGVTTTGDGYCWGSNESGELGAGLASDVELAPVLVAGGHKWKNISPGLLYTCGVANDGGGHCWGANWSGERGDGAFPAADRRVPGPVAGQLQFQSIDADWHTCGVTVDGEVYCWGAGLYGSIGNGTMRDVGIPTAVGGN